MPNIPSQKALRSASANCGNVALRLSHQLKQYSNYVVIYLTAAAAASSSREVIEQRIQHNRFSLLTVQHYQKNDRDNAPC